MYVFFSIVLFKLESSKVKGKKYSWKKSFAFTLKPYKGNDSRKIHVLCLNFLPVSVSQKD